MKIRIVEIAVMAALSVGAAPFFVASSSADGVPVKAVDAAPAVVETVRAEAPAEAPACERKVKVVYGSEVGKTVCAAPRG